MVEFSKKSWHFRMAKLVTNRWDLNNRMNICTYVRKVLMGTLVFTFIAGVISFFAVFNAFGIAMAALHGADAWSDSWFGAINFLTLVLTVVFAGPALWSHYDVEWKLRKFFRNVGNALTFRKKTEKVERPRKEPLLLVTWYRSVKDKFCVNIRFVGDEQ